MWNPSFKELYLKGRASQNSKCAKQFSQILIISEKVWKFLTATKNS